MRFYEWRLQMSLEAARHGATARQAVIRPDHERQIARWREAMALERRFAWPADGPEPVPVLASRRRPPG